MKGYDAFISYSHALDKPIASALQSVIQTLGKPWWRRRMSRVFRDDTSLSASPHLWFSIEDALSNSRFMILIASPEAATSKWICKEVETWLTDKGSSTLLLALTSGELAWDEACGDFGWASDTPLPKIIRGRFLTEPLWIDLRAYRNNPRDGREFSQGFLSSAAAFASAIRGVPKDDLLSDEVVQQRRNVRWAQAAVLGLLALAAAAVSQALLAVDARNSAVEQRDRAERTLSQIVASADRRVVALSVRTTERGQHDAEDMPHVMAARDESDQTAALDSAEKLVTASSDDLSKDKDVAALKEAERALAILQARSDQSSNLAWQKASIKAFDQYAQTAKKVGEPQQAEAALQNAYAIARRLLQASPNDILLMRMQAFAEQNLSYWYLDQQQHGRAELYFRQAYETRQRIISIEPTAETKRELADSFRGLGDLSVATEKTDQAIDDYKQSIALIDDLLRADPQDHELERDQSVNYQHVADALRHAGNNTEAITWLNMDLGIAERLSAADRKNLVSQHDLASSVDRLAWAEEALGAADAALANYRRALGILETIIAQTPNAPAWQRDTAAVGETIGKLLLQQGNNDEAVGLLRRSLSLRQGLAASFEEGSWQLELEAAYRRISELMWKMNRRQDAFEIAEQYLLATALSPDRGVDKSSRVGRALGTLCWSAVLAGKLPRAVWAGEQGIILAPDLDWIRINYAHALMFSGQTAAASKIYLSGLQKEPAGAAAWRQAIRDDFDVFQRHNMNNDLMKEIAQQSGR
jgi:tetratricopeptide (TPR) repeat protein